MTKRKIYLFWLKQIKGRFDLNQKRVIPSSVKLDVLIPAVEKDLEVLSYAIDGARENIKHPLGEIIIVAPNSEKIKALCKIKGCRFVNEDFVLPITKKDVEYFVDGVDWSGWLFQQFLKLSGDTICSQDYYLALDADTILLKPQVFLQERKTLFNCRKKCCKPYFRMYERLLGQKPFPLISFVSHHMLFEKDKVRRLKEAIETRNGLKWYAAVIKKSDGGEVKFSEYETYGNFVLSNYPNQVVMNYCFNKSLSREKLQKIDKSKKTLSRKFKSVSFHSYNSGDYFKSISLETRAADKRFWRFADTNPQKPE